VIVIGLCGPAGSGKTTIAEYMARTYGARHFALAEPIKEIVYKAFGVPRESLWGTQAQKEVVIPGLGMSGRQLMQKIGTDGIRAVLGNSIWVRHTMGLIHEACIEGGRLAVVADVRFLSEAVGIRLAPELIGPRYIWKIDHPWLRTADEHQSETEWRQVRADHVISTPTKSLDTLYLAVDRACAKFGIKPTLTSIEAP
jgi:hypothetical protein